MKNKYELYLVTDTGICPRENLLACVEKAIIGGVTMVQLREKEISSRDFYNEAAALKKITEKYNVPLIINDRLDIMLAADADGLHIGQSDIPASAARKLIGENKILGISAGNLADAKAAKADGADYLGVGAVFPTSTKKDAEFIGTDILKEIKEEIKLPIVGIGGIQNHNIAALYGSEIDGVAVVSAIMGSSDPEDAARELKKHVMKF